MIYNVFLKMNGNTDSYLHQIYLLNQFHCFIEKSTLLWLVHVLVGLNMQFVLLTGTINPLTGTVFFNFHDKTGSSQLVAYENGSIPKCVPILPKLTKLLKNVHI